MGYFKEFLQLVNENNIEDFNKIVDNIDIDNIKLKNLVKRDPLRLFQSKELRDYIVESIENKSDMYELVILFRSYLKKTIRTTYRCLYEEDLYFIGVDMNINMYCIYYKNLLVLDIDYPKMELSNDSDSKKMLKNIKIINKCKMFNKKYGDTFMIYSTKNGYHIFVVNRLVDKNSIETINYMVEFGVDFNYIVFSSYVGFVIRLNKKSFDDPMYSYIDTIGNDMKYKDLVDVHLIASDEFQDILTYNANNFNKS